MTVPTCNAITTTGSTVVVLVCQRPQGHDGKHRCLLPRTGGNAVHEWSTPR